MIPPCGFFAGGIAVSQLCGRIVENINTVDIRDTEGLLFFVEMPVAGFYEKGRQYLRKETPLSMESIIDQTCRIFRQGVSAYR